MKQKFAQEINGMVLEQNTYSNFRDPGEMLCSSNDSNTNNSNINEDWIRNSFRFPGTAALNNL